MLAWAAWQLQFSPDACGTLRKHVAKPFPQPAAPDCIVVTLALNRMQVPNHSTIYSLLTNLEPGRPLLCLVERLNEETRDDGEHEAGQHLQHERVQPQVDGVQQEVIRLRQAAPACD